MLCPGVMVARSASELIIRNLTNISSNRRSSLARSASKRVLFLTHSLRCPPPPTLSLLVNTRLFLYITVTGNTSLDMEIGIVRASLAELIQFATRVRSRLCLCLSGLFFVWLRVFVYDLSFFPWRDGFNLSILLQGHHRRPMFSASLGDSPRL